MRKLIAHEIHFISGARDVNYYFDYYANTLLFSGYIAESAFIGYCGYQLAVATGVVSGFVGASLGATAGLFLISFVLGGSK